MTQLIVFASCPLFPIGGEGVAVLQMTTKGFWGDILVLSCIKVWNVHKMTTCAYSHQFMHVSYFTHRIHHENMSYL